MQHGLRLPWTSSLPTCLMRDTGARGARGKLEYSLTKVQKAVITSPGSGITYEDTTWNPDSKEFEQPDKL